MKDTGLLVRPFTVTTTGPLVAPAGTIALIVVSDQLLMLAGAPLNVTVLLPCWLPNCEPLMETVVPGRPCCGFSDAIAGPQRVGFEVSAVAPGLSSPVPPATSTVESRSNVAVSRLRLNDIDCVGVKVPVAGNKYDVSGTSTWDDLGDATASRRRRLGRRAGFTLLLGVVLLGLFGLLGPRERTASAEESGYELEVTYGSVIRSGQPVPLEISVTSPVPFDGPVEIALDPSVFERMDFQNWYPNPDTETRTADELSYEFEPPDGDRFDVHLDARVSPGLTLGPEDYWVAVVVGGSEVVRVDYTVWVAP